MDRTVNAAGIIVFARTEPLSFLLLQHKDRWDLPKGHAEPGETLIETALRETEEETGIPAADIDIDGDFEFKIQYLVSSEQRGTYHKCVTYFLGFTDRRPEILPTEHIGYAWFPWPAGQIQAQTIDPLLAAVKRHLDNGRPQAL